MNKIKEAAPLVEILKKHGGPVGEAGAMLEQLAREVDAYERGMVGIRDEAEGLQEALEQAQKRVAELEAAARGTVITDDPATWPEFEQTVIAETERGTIRVGYRDDKTYCRFWCYDSRGWVDIVRWWPMPEAPVE